MARHFGLAVDVDAGFPELIEREIVVFWPWSDEERSVFEHDVSDTSVPVR